MDEPEIAWIASQLFTCEPPKGAEFEVTVRIGKPSIVQGAGHPYERCRVGLEPLAKDRWIGGANGFQALCLALDYIRTVLKLFVAEGGRIYWGDSRDLADLESPSFTPKLEMARVGLRLDGSKPLGSAE